MNSTQVLIPIILLVYLMVVIWAFVLLRRNSKRAWILVSLSLLVTFLIVRVASAVFSVDIYYFNICNPDGSQDYTGYYVKLILNLIFIASGALLPSIMAYKFIKKQHVSSLIFLLGLMSMVGLGAMGTSGFVPPSPCLKMPYSIIF